jgi:hypothetical protein
MRGNANNRWLFAAMGVAVQTAQRIAFALSTWKIKNLVLGIWVVLEENNGGKVEI